MGGAAASATAGSSAGLAAAFFAGSAFAADLAGAFLAGAFAVLADAVFFVVVAATARMLTGMATEMPRPARCVISALRSRASTPASSVARRTSSGATLPEGCACAMRAWMEGCASTPGGGVLRAFEDTNTSRQGASGRGKARCRQEPRFVILPRTWWQPRTAVHLT